MNKQVLQVGGQHDVMLQIPVKADAFHVQVYVGIVVRDALKGAVLRRGIHQKAADKIQAGVYFIHEEINHVLIGSAGVLVHDQCRRRSDTQKQNMKRDQKNNNKEGELAL